jgi:gamma-glutamylcysteine synthetase
MKKEMQHQACSLKDAVELFRSGFRTDLDAQEAEPRWVGLENEYLMVSADGEAIGPEVLAHLWQALVTHGWTPITDELSQQIVAVIRPDPDPTNRKLHSFDLITTDFGYATLEIDLAPARSLTEARLALHRIVEVITSILHEHEAVLLGYGVQPVVAPTRGYLGPKSRYQLMFDTREAENDLNPEAWSVDLHCINAACQTQVEVSERQALPIVNALNATSGLRIALLAHSSVWQNRVSEYKAVRQLFWDWCWPARKLQFGIPPRFQSLEHYVDYIFDFRPIAVKRDHTFYRIDNHRAFRHFYLAEHGAVGITACGAEQRIFGEPEDLKTQCGFAWFDARLQPTYGTVEDRVSCQQPPQAHFCAAALTLGLVENYRACIKVADCLSLDQWRDIRILACTHGQDFSYPGVDIKGLLQHLLDIARQGLTMRHFGEEVYLEPLYQRVAQARCPADEVREQFLTGGVHRIIAVNDMKNLV